MYPLQTQYDAFTQAAGFAKLASRSQIVVSGKDRVKFVNNFCTADLRKLQPGQGTEAFFCNVKGKVLAHAFVFVLEDRLLIDATPGRAEVLMPHLDRYILMDDVQLQDASPSRGQTVVGGRQALAAHQSWVGKPIPADSPAASEGPHETIIFTSAQFGPRAYVVDFPSQNRSNIAAALQAFGAIECEPQIAEIIRLEAGVPLYGVDITDENLPQEANRNAQAISFTKGCYLGQETVARIDALGHVNKLLVGLKFTGEQVPAAGTELRDAGKPVGHVTSAVFSPLLQAPLALGYVRSGHSEVGHRVESAVGTAEVIALPLKDS